MLMGTQTLMVGFELGEFISSGVGSFNVNMADFFLVGWIKHLQTSTIFYGVFQARNGLLPIGR